MEEKYEVRDDDVARCPKCGSTQIEFVTYQASQNISGKKMCCGAMICAPMAALCGIGKKTPAKSMRKCKKCGHEF